MSKKLVKARVISDAPHLALAIGMIALAPAPIIESLAKALVVDPHPDAVKYAEGEGCPVVKLQTPDQAAAAAALEARIAELQAQLATAADDAAKAPLAAELAAKQAELAELG